MDLQMVKHPNFPGLKRAAATVASRSGENGKVATGQNAINNGILFAGHLPVRRDRRRCRLIMAYPTVRRVRRLNKTPNRFFAFDLPEAVFREMTDALVIFSMSFLTYVSIAEWGGLSILRNVLRLEIETPSLLYFCGVALVVFSIRRIADQRREREKRVAAEHN